MRIGIDARFFGPFGKGLGRYTQKLILNLEKIDQQNDYFILLRQENWEDYHPINPRFHKVLANYRWYSLAEQMGMLRTISSLHLNLMHFTHFNVPIFYRGDFIVTIHDLILTKYPTQRATTLGPLLYFFKHWSYSLVIRQAIKRARKVIAVSECTKKDIMDHFQVDEDKIYVTYEAVDPPKSIDKTDKRVLTKFDIKQPYILYVGNMYPHKNIEGLLKAFKDLSVVKPGISLVLVGKEDYFVLRIKQLVEKLGISSRVYFPGFVSDEELPYLYALAKAYVFPSFYEGFGLPALEAMSYGTPVIASQESCLPEILGSAAAYFNPHDTTEMTRQMTKVLDDAALTENLKKSGFDQIKKFSWGKMVDQTLDLYLKM